MAVTTAMIKELRERTGLGMLECKGALAETYGDIEAAIESLRKKSSLKAAKKAGRTTADGLLGLKVAADGSRAALVEINIETDFAAKNEKFKAFVEKMANAAYDIGESDPLDALNQQFNAERETLVQEIGENIAIRRAVVFAPKDGGYVAHYLHGDQRKASLVEMTKSNVELGKDLAMHVTAMNPMVVRGEDIAADVVAKEREIYTAQAAESGKPADIVAKMVEGRVRKFLAESSLLEQPFVKDPNQKVGQLCKQAGLECRRLVRFEVGEGIEKVEMDFAAEVAAQVKSSQGG
ncbi:MAG: elongation factor Ts [Gammaproteobacteria bacterium]|nr:elongation factor Ts [Gammaproteobacteria bacterium]